MATIADLIRQAAAKYGIDPETALAVAKTEGYRESGFVQGDKDANGDFTSFGPYQLHYAGHGGGMGQPGLGDAFTAATGLNARDPNTVAQQIDFALKNASKSGWGQWHGAAAHGIGDHQGIGGAPVMGVGSIKPVSPLDDQYAADSGVTYPGTTDPKAAGVGSIGASFAAGTAPTGVVPAAPAAEPTAPAAAPDGMAGLGQIFAQALRAQPAAEAPKPQYSGPLTSPVSSKPLGAYIPHANTTQIA